MIAARVDPVILNELSTDLSQVLLRSAKCPPLRAVRNIPLSINVECINFHMFHLPTLPLHNQSPVQNNVASLATWEVASHHHEDQ